MNMLTDWVIRRLKEGDDTDELWTAASESCKWSAEVATFARSVAGELGDPRLATLAEAFAANDRHAVRIAGYAYEIRERCWTDLDIAALWALERLGVGGRWGGVEGLASMSVLPLGGRGKQSPAYGAHRAAFDSAALALFLRERGYWRPTPTTYSIHGGSLPEYLDRPAGSRHEALAVLIYCVTSNPATKDLAPAPWWRTATAWALAWGLVDWARMLAPETEEEDGEQ